MSTVKIYFCDVCGKDLTEERGKRGSNFEYTIGGFSVQDLCFDCFHTINKFIVSLKKEKK